MCGIAGKLSWSKKPEELLVKKITDEMQLRGPDASGFYFDEHVGLGHRRLAIIDLSESGRQPMSDNSHRYQIIFNGEIYNYLELKSELTKLGAIFKTQSDTEIILEGYKFWGKDCVQKFNEMFVFALWDTVDKKLFLSRDRLGKKPIFYYELPDSGIIFSSELKALLHDPELKKTLNLDAVNQYLSLGYILSDQAIIKDVKKLPPASCLLLSKGEKTQLWKYWHLEESFHKKRIITESEAAEELKSLLDDAIKIRMIADVPLGAFLSGGIDSSTIVASMAALTAAQKVKTYSIGFKEKSYSELPEAKRVADLMKVSHRQEIVDCQMAEIIEELVRHADEPFADNSMIPMYYLSLFAKKEVTVALSGDGGDEMFSGYETYTADELYQIFKLVPKSMLGFASSMIYKFLADNF